MATHFNRYLLQVNCKGTQQTHANSTFSRSNIQGSKQFSHSFPKALVYSGVCDRFVHGKSMVSSWPVGCQVLPSTQRTPTKADKNQQKLKGKSRRKRKTNRRNPADSASFLLSPDLGLMLQSWCRGKNVDCQIKRRRVPPLFCHFQLSLSWNRNLKVF